MDWGPPQLEIEWDRLICGIEEKESVQKVLREFPNVLSSKTGRTKASQHNIHCAEEKPIAIRPYRMSREKTEVMTNLTREMERNGIIEPSTSPWAAPVVLVPKKDGSWRYCVDYRALNQVTEKDPYPIPNLMEIIFQLRNAKIFSTIDLRSGYWQVELNERSKKYTAFATPCGLYQFKVLPFGLKNSPSTFQRLMNEVLRGYIGTFCFVYLDDILIFSENLADHLGHLHRVMHRLRNYGLTCNLKKCRFALKELSYLGHYISEEGIRKNRDKMKAMEEYAVPRNAKELQRFIGLCQWFNNSVDKLAMKLEPLSKLLRKNVKWQWKS